MARIALLPSLLLLSSLSLGAAPPADPDPPEDGDEIEDTDARTPHESSMTATDFDARWNYRDAAATEQVFRELLPTVTAEGDPDRVLELQTQIARSLGLQGRFDEANALLDEIEPALVDAGPTPRVRALLERGRARNSGGEEDRGAPLFERAWELARAEQQHGYAVDAAHMLGIVMPGEEGIRWNDVAIEHAQGSEAPAAKRWLGALFNNQGWNRHERGEHEEALRLFRLGQEWREQSDADKELEQPSSGTIVARWAVGRALRSLGRLDEAMDVQEGVRAAWEAAGGGDGYVFEELGELHLAQGRDAEAQEQFARAWTLLSADGWMMSNEKVRMRRIWELGVKAVDADAVVPEGLAEEPAEAGAEESTEAGAGE